MKSPLAALLPHTQARDLDKLFDTMPASNDAKLIAVAVMMAANEITFHLEALLSDTHDTGCTVADSLLDIARATEATADARRQQEQPA